MPSEITLTSKMGHFVFDAGVILSRAKLLRDAITTQFFNPQSGTKIKSAADAEKYARTLSNDLAEIEFEVVFRPTE